MALDRTWLAHERTLMAWVRTATSMISFAFTIYKFFQLENSNGRTGGPQGMFSPRDFAIFMVSIGLVSLFLATIEHRRELKQINAQMSTRRYSLAGVVAILVSVFGLAVLISTVLRL
jgi:putative membrane protein